MWAQQAAAEQERGLTDGQPPVSASWEGDDDDDDDDAAQGGKSVENLPGGDGSSGESQDVPAIAGVRQSRSLRALGGGASVLLSSRGVGGVDAFAGDDDYSEDEVPSRPTMPEELILSETSGGGGGGVLGSPAGQQGSL